MHQWVEVITNSLLKDEVPEPEPEPVKVEPPVTLPMETIVEEQYHPESNKAFNEDYEVMPAQSHNYQ